MANTMAMSNTNASTQTKKNANPLESQSEEDVAAILSVSMPITAVYPEAFFTCLAKAPEAVLRHLIQKPEGAHARFIKEVQRQNRKEWTRRANAGKAVSSEDAKAAAETTEVIRERRHWYMAQMEKMVMGEEAATSVAF